MRIESLLIDNFRGIKHARLTEIGNTIVIAGQNGSGKSCVFDAIRLLKSVYGGYQQNEWQSWLGEFQINANNRSDGLSSLFRDVKKPILIEAEFSLHDSEKATINNQAVSLLTDSAWRTLLPDAFQYESAYRVALFSKQFREKEPEVKKRVEQLLPLLQEELALTSVTGRLTVVPGSTTLSTPDSALLTVLFSTYRPREIGVIDYHGAQRFYSREQVQTVNISLQQSDQQASQNSLYNAGNKYAGVKSELASSYIKEALSEKAGGAYASTAGLTDTLQDLFQTFFPDKVFLGPQPTPEGNLLFPVQTRDGSRHDLDDLSAGEKEILYGYLRIRNSAPRHSIVLLDEPELHLNPKLIRSLPEFYRKNIGQALENQMWLVTHSDAILRESVGKPGFNVYHMQQAGLPSPGGHITSQFNQLKPLTLKEDLDSAVTELVGDLAAYQPGRKGVIFEGGGNSDFDQSMTSLLFPDLAEQANLISGTNKAKVKALHEVLSRSYEKGKFPFKFYAIVDGDYDLPVHSGDDAVRRFVWDVYHIENYLLEPAIISHVVCSFGLNKDLDDEQTLDELRKAARGTVSRILKHRLTQEVSRTLLGKINFSFDPAAEDLAGGIHEATKNSLERLAAAGATELDIDSIRAIEAKERASIESAFADGSWRKTLPGREILKSYVATLPNGISYEVFRSMLLNRMLDVGYKPIGMKNVVEDILND